MNKILKYITILLLALVVSILFIDRLPQLVTIILFSVGFIYFVIQKVDKEMRNKIIVLFFITFLLQISVSLFLYCQTVETKYYGFSYKGDDYVYGDFGVIVGDLWRKGIFPSLRRLSYYNLIGMSAKVQMYQLYTAFIFYLFNKYGVQILLIINCFLHAAIIIPAYFICKNLRIRSNIIMFTFLLFLFWPSTFYWSLFNFKEPMLLFSIFVIFRSFIEIEDNPHILSFILLLFSLFLIYALKVYLFFIFLVMLLFYFSYFYEWTYRKKMMVLMSLFVLIMLQITKGPFFCNLYSILPKFSQTLHDIRHYAITSNTPFFGNIFAITYLRIALYFPFGLFAVLFLPFLLRPFSLYHIVVNVESILWWCTFPLLIGGIWGSVKIGLRRTFPMVFIFVAWLIVLALTQGNMGTLVRQKSIIYYVGFIFISLAIDRTLNFIEEDKLRKKG